MIKFPSKGLYAITRGHQDVATIDQLCHDVELAILGGASVVQYRDKQSPYAMKWAKRLLACCHQYGVPLIINDDITLAKTIGADGVHLGRDDGLISDAKAQLGAEAIIGVSCYNSLQIAIDAQENGASYVAFGRFFASNSKPLALPAQVSTLTLAKAQLHVPIVAIGGILVSNGATLLDAGADLLAVIGGLATSNPQNTAREYCRLFEASSDE